MTVGDNGYTTFGEWHCAADEAADPDGHMATIGIMAHEFGHDINWPDLYDIDCTSEGIGEFSLMSGGSWGQSPDAGSLAGDSPAHPDAWALWYQGWVDARRPSPPATKDIQVPVGESVLVVPEPQRRGLAASASTPAPASTSWSRTVSREGFDDSIPGCGLVVYRIDETVTSSNGANSDEDDPLVKVIEADGMDDMDLNVNRGDDGRPVPRLAPRPRTSTTHDAERQLRHRDPVGTGPPPGLRRSASDTMQIDVKPHGGLAAAGPPRQRRLRQRHVDLGRDRDAERSRPSTRPWRPAKSPARLGGAASVWFKWTAPASGDVTVDTIGSSYDTVLGLYTGSARHALTLIDENDDAPTAAAVPAR